VDISTKKYFNAEFCNEYAMAFTKVIHQKREKIYEALAKLRKTVTPAKAGVQNYLN
jgi:hypothetical protein